MFNKADKNKDGKLTPEEWRQVLNASGVPTTMWVWFFSFKIKKCKYCFSCSFSFSTFYKNNMQSYKVWNKFFIDQPQYVSMKKYFHCDTLKACAAFCSTLYIFPFSSSSRDDVLVHNNVVISSTSASRNLHYFRLLSLQLRSGNSVYIPPSHTMLFHCKIMRNLKLCSNCLSLNNLQLTLNCYWQERSNKVDLGTCLQSWIAEDVKLWKFTMLWKRESIRLHIDKYIVFEHLLEKFVDVQNFLQNSTLYNTWWNSSNCSNSEN